MNDYKEFKHGEESSHFACPPMVEKYGDKVGCCGCNGHNCTPEDRSYFDMTDTEKQEIIDKAASDSNKAQRELVTEAKKCHRKKNWIVYYEKGCKHYDPDITGVPTYADRTFPITKYVTPKPTKCTCRTETGGMFERTGKCLRHGQPSSGVASENATVKSTVKVDSRQSKVDVSGEGWEEEFENILISIFGRRNEEGFFEIHAGTHYKGVNNIKAFIKSELSKQKEQIRKKVEALKPTLGDVHTWEKNKILDSVSKLLSEE